MRLLENVGQDRGFQPGPLLSFSAREEATFSSKGGSRAMVELRLGPNRPLALTHARTPLDPRIIIVIAKLAECPAE